MRMKALLLSMAIVVALGGCNLWNQLFGSSSATITSFTIDGIVGTATVDLTAHTVVATVEPLDISAIAPTVTVSAGATLTTAPLQDGVPATFTVTAQNGTATSWQVTVNVEYGTSFTVDGTTKVVMTHGYVDPSLTYSADLIGNDQAVGYTYSTTTYVDSFAADQQVHGGGPLGHTYLDFGGTSVGSYTESNASFNYDDGTGNVLNIDSNTSLSSGTFSVNEYGTAFGQTIQGSFIGTASDGSNTHSVTKGFFKVLTVDNSTHWANRPLL